MHLSRQLNHLHGGDDGNDNLAVKVQSCLFFACRIDNPIDCIALLFHGGQLSDSISIDEKYIYHQNLKRIHHPPMHNSPMLDYLVGSCNGLVCTFQLHNSVLDPIYICNPLTREYTYLPELVVKKEDVGPGQILKGEVNMIYNTACGFGYVASTNEYKVVRIYYVSHLEGNVEVYTLGSGCGWRQIGRVSYRLNFSRNGTGTYASDSIYWISSNKIVVFDLAEEEFRFLSGPPCLENRNLKDMCGLVTLGRHLCFYIDKLRMEIWSLMESSNSKETWSMEFDLDYKAVVGSGKNMLNSWMFEPILLTKNGEIVCVYAKSVLYCYDKETSFLKKISNKASSDNLEDVKAIAHVNTFASLEAMGEHSKRYTLRTPWDDVIDELDRVALGEEIDTTRFKLV